MEAFLALVGLAEFLAILSSVSYGGTQALVRLGMRNATPFGAALVINGCTATGGIILSLWDGTLLASTFWPLFWYAVIGVTGPGIGRLTSFIGIARIGLSRSTTISSSTPIWGIAFAVLILHESPSLGVVLGTLAVVAGVAILTPSEGERERLGGWLQGALIYPLLCSLAYALPPVFNKLAYAHQETPYVGMAVAFSTGNLVILAFKGAMPGQVKLAVGRQARPWLLAGGALSCLSSIFLWNALLLGSVSTTLPLSRMVPLWVLLISYFFMGRIERITRRDVGATLLVAAGGVLITAFRG
ncbi:MAG: DMT family transporter [Nitrospinota bacterium]